MLPIPATRRAILIADGSRSATPHVFVETRELGSSPDGAEYEFIFRCVRSEKTRRWGTAFVEFS